MKRPTEDVLIACFVSALTVIVCIFAVVGIHHVVFDRHPPRRSGAVSQVERLYACVTPAGTVTRVHAYRIACAEADQTVTWKVSAP